MVGFTLPHLAAQLWRQRQMLLAIVLCSGLVGLLAIIFAQPVYTATMLVAPKPSDLSLDNSHVDLGSFALGRTSSTFSPMDVYGSLVTSRAVADVLAKNPDLMHRMFGGSWDPQSRTWRRPPGVVEWFKDQVRPLLGHARWHAPDGANVADYIQALIQIHPVSSTLLGASSVQALTIELSDPGLAVDILSGVHGAADHIIRNRNLSGVDSEIFYLNQELRSPQSSETREALIRVLANLEERKILLKSQEDFAVIVIDPPHASPAPTYPQPVLIIGSFLLLGVIFGVIVVMCFWSRPAPVVRVGSLLGPAPRVLDWVPVPDWALGTGAE